MSRKKGEKFPGKKGTTNKESVENDDDSTKTATTDNANPKMKRVLISQKGQNASMERSFQDNTISIFC